LVAFLADETQRVVGNSGYDPSIHLGFELRWLIAV